MSSRGTGAVALLLCELVVGLLICLRVFWFGRLGGNHFGDVEAAKIAKALPLTKLTYLE